MKAQYYRAATPTTVVAAAGSAMFFVIAGSATKKVTIHSIKFSGLTLTAVAYNNIVVEKWSTNPTTGTPVVLTKIPIDSSSPASTCALCQVYTAAPTEGTAIGPITSKRVLMEATTAVAAVDPNDYEFDFRDNEGESNGIILNSAAECISLAFGASPATAVTMSIEVEWSEE